MCTLALEIFKTLNNPNPNLMKDIFNFSPYSTHRTMIFLFTVEIHQIMVIEASELLHHIHGTPYQKISNSPLL